MVMVVMLPEDGEVRLASVVLPPGTRQFAESDPDNPVAWVTSVPVTGAGRIWQALSHVRAETGLTPVLLGDAEPDPDVFREPHDLAEVESRGAVTVLESRWAESFPPDETGLWAKALAPFSARFPGLAEPTGTSVTHVAHCEALETFASALICLVSADRPADILPVIGWAGPDLQYPDCVSIASVLRSWEDRFGARLLHVGPGAEIRLLVSRPPDALTHALPIAAELLALGHAYIDDYRKPRADLTTVSGIASAIVGNPVWGLWWD